MSELSEGSLWQIRDPQDRAEFARILEMPWEGRTYRVELLRITPLFWTVQMDKDRLERAVELGLWVPAEPLISGDATHADLKDSSFFRSPIVPKSSGTAAPAISKSSSSRGER